MDKKLHQASEWLEKQMVKDKVEIENHKNKMIEEIKKINKMEMFKETQIKKISILDKLLLILGYGKKR